MFKTLTPPPKPPTPLKLSPVDADAVLIPVSDADDNKKYSP